MKSAGGDLHYPGKEDRGSILNFDKMPGPILQKPLLLLVPQIHALGALNPMPIPPPPVPSMSTDPIISPVLKGKVNKKKLKIL